MQRAVRSRAFACLFLGLALMGPTVAWADEPTPDTTVEAKAQFRQGSEAFAQKRFVEAAMHFETAAALRPHAVPLYTAALAWDTAGRPERAADAFSRALELPGLDAKQTANAKERVEALERTLGVLVLTVPSAWKVQLDTLTTVTGPARLHAAPGAHVLTLQPNGLPIERRDVALEAGKATPLTLTEADLASAKKPEPAPPPKVEPPPPPPPPPPPKPPSFPLRPIGFAAVGAGGALILGGIVLGTQANGAGTAYNAGPTRESYDHASGLQTWTTVALVSGIVVAGVGLTLVLLPGKSETKVAISPTSITLGGTFQ